MVYLSRRSLCSNIVNNPFISIIGSGPAAFYTAYKIFQLNPQARIDMYEKNVFPYGLVRYGVAPDHNEVKNCVHKFEEVANYLNFRYFGNVEVGKSIPLSSISNNYHACIFAYGASKPRKLNIALEDQLDNVNSATDFVNWYNGHPNYKHKIYNLKNRKHVLIIGQGNVALDVARILLSPVDFLRHTEIPDYALEELSESSVKKVTIVGRRGPQHVSFTAKELRDILKLENVYFENSGIDQVKQAFEKINQHEGLEVRPLKRILKLLSTKKPVSTLNDKTLDIKYFLKPESFVKDCNSMAAIGMIFNKRIAIELSIEDTNEFEKIETDMIFTSLGVDSVPLQDYESIGLKFDPELHIVTSQGRILDPQKIPFEGSALPGLYAAGWVCNKNRAGVIAKTMLDAQETAMSLISDWKNPDISFLHERSAECLGFDGIEISKRPKNIVSWKDWQALDCYERKKGQDKGKIRDKILDSQHALELLQKLRKLF